MAKTQRMVLARVFVAAVAVVSVCSFITSPTFVPPAGRSPLQTGGVHLSAAAGATSALFGAMSAAHADPVDDAGKEFAAAAYPIFKSFDWVKNPLINKWLASASMEWSPNGISVGAERLLDVALSMDPKLVMSTVALHDRALKNAMTTTDLVAPIEDIEEIASSVARLIASAGPEKNQAMYNAFQDAGAQNYNRIMFESIEPGQAAEVYKAFLQLAQAASA